ncbi:hypothetical protein AR689_12540 [Arthrobacter sp. EpRS71]|nr:hypothetical protein AR689_12540 [Arthrobacter sp. EpRS71]
MGSFITWAIGLLPVLEPHREDLLEYGTPLLAIIAAVLIAAWYVFWRWLEPRIPDWLTRAFLGSAKTPEYGKHEAGATITGNITVATLARLLTTPGNGTAIKTRDPHPHRVGVFCRL